jgi:hypothetical protein
VLLLNEADGKEPKAFSAVAEHRANDTDPVIFKLRGLVTNREFLVRVQVDGVESPLDLVDGVYGAPKVKVP